MRRTVTTNNGTVLLSTPEHELPNPKTYFLGTKLSNVWSSKKILISVI